MIYTYIYDMYMYVYITHTHTHTHTHNTYTSQVRPYQQHGAGQQHRRDLRSCMMRPRRSTCRTHEVSITLCVCVRVCARALAYDIAY